MGNTYYEEEHKLFLNDPKKCFKNENGEFVDLRTKEEKLSDEKILKGRRRTDLEITIIKWVLGLGFAIAIMSAFQ